MFDAVGSPEFEKQASRINAEGLRRLGATPKNTSMRKTKEKLAISAHNRSVTPRAHNDLPPLPAFDKSWDVVVQVKWLEVWSSKG